MHRITHFRPTPAMVVASIALLVALAGTGAAAVALVPKNSVGSPQVIDGSLQSRDFGAGQVLAASDVFSNSVAGPVVPRFSDDFSTIASLSIPKPGVYVISSTARVVSSNLGGACRLFAGDARDDSTSAAPLASATMWNVVVQAFPSTGNVDLQCGGYAKGPTQVRDIRITAIRLSSQTNP